MNPDEMSDIVERKILELRILTNANWKKQEYELAVMGEKILRSIEMAKALSESACSIMEKLPASINELKDSRQFKNFFEGQNLESLKF